MNATFKYLVAVSTLGILVVGCEPDAPLRVDSTQSGGLLEPAFASVASSGCFGRTATVYVGSDGRIVGGGLDGQVYTGRIEGTSASDVIVGTEGDDQIFGGPGEDRICALGGNDEVHGEEGDDSVLGGAGDDDLRGGPGEDNLLGDAGTDRAQGDGSFDNCEAESSVGCEWTAPVSRLVCPASVHMWELVPGTGRDVSFNAMSPPGRLQFMHLNGNQTLPPSMIAEYPQFPVNHTVQLLTMEPRISQPHGVQGNTFTTFATPLAPAGAETRGKRLETYIEAWAPGAVTTLPCTVRALVLDPRLQSSVGEDLTIRTTAGAAALNRTVRFFTVGRWSHLGLVYDVKIDYVTGGSGGWLTAAATGFDDVFSDAEGDLNMTVDPSGLAPGRYVALVTMRSLEFPAVPHAELEVILFVDPPATP